MTTKRKIHSNNDAFQRSKAIFLDLKFDEMSILACMDQVMKGEHINTSWRIHYKSIMKRTM